MQGFLNLHKPAGLTSHDCVARVRRLLQTKKVGHGGTLDPAATGVLPIAVGRATRLLPYLATGKAYQAVVRFGLQTTTDDLEGEILRQASAAELQLADILPLLPQFQGAIAQVPPSYSAVQVGGRRLYALARQGEAVIAPVRTVTVEQIQVLGWQPGEQAELTLAIRCGPGTYIRAIARDLGTALGPGATLASLLRTHSSGFDLANSQTLTELEAQAAADAVELCPPEQALAHLPVLVLAGDWARRWRQGQKIPQAEAEAAPAGLYRLCEANQFLGIAEISAEIEGAIVPKMVYQPLG